ncbi:non-specific lipid transfer protein GPI-anchored 12-like [Salvia miltiorrhiza]|uniref:non-specific lipid transfer protein GPI-anchored 12-like n=1 Tax=Salvia miltiorrhiza TaxID=226208 RepID=UPI0025AD609A|nr:non-specific lipid transfer protein GPI-anchored 12-like [Salvia miltiorrhiza]
MFSTTTIAYPLMLAIVMAAAATAQSPAPAPAVEAPGPFYPVAPAPALDCFTYLLNLSDCLTFVQEGSNLTEPDKGCCPELGNLVDTQPICLCQLLGDPSQVGISVDVDRALKLPSLCNVTTPPVSLCAAIGIPVSALAPSEAPSPGGGETASPPSPGGDDGSATSLVSKHHFLIGLASLFFIYFF